MRRLENNVFLFVVAAATLALGWIVLPYSGAILWGVIAAILFGPLNERLLAMMPGRASTAALITLAIIIAIVVIPALVIGVLLVQEASALYEQLRGGHIDFAAMFAQAETLMPKWASGALERVGVTDFDDIRDRMASGIAASFQWLAGQALSIGQSTFGFFATMSVALYLLFFLLRDGRDMAAMIDNAVPLPQQIRRELAEKFVTVTRATINGSVVVAIVQGMIGGIIFSLLDIPGALLWGVVMAFFSLLPAIGTGLVWVPVAIYLLASGAVWQGAVLIGCGVFIIGMVDNVLRPILVGRDTRIPDYLVLISTLGGLEIFGFNGIVIGPVIASVFLSVWEIFASTRRHTVRAAQD